MMRIYGAGKLEDRATKLEASAPRTFAWLAVHAAFDTCYHAELSCTVPAVRGGRIACRWSWRWRELRGAGLEAQGIRRVIGRHACARMCIRALHAARRCNDKVG